MQATATQQCNILIADDEKAVSTTVSFIVKRLGHAVEVVNDGEPALDKIRQQPDHYQLLITDHAMLKMDGLKLMEHLKRPGFRGKILVLSGYLSPELEEAYRSMGADRIMHKPFDTDTLRKAVNELMDWVHC